MFLRKVIIYAEAYAVPSKHMCNMVRRPYLKLWQQQFRTPCVTRSRTHCFKFLKRDTIFKRWTAQSVFIQKWVPPIPYFLLPCRCPTPCSFTWEQASLYLICLHLSKRAQVWAEVKMTGIDESEEIEKEGEGEYFQRNKRKNRLFNSQL